MKFDTFYYQINYGGKVSLFDNPFTENKNIVHILSKIIGGSLIGWVFLRLLLRLQYFRKRHFHYIPLNGWTVVFGATGGLGKTICQYLINQRTHFILVSRDSSKLKNLQQLLKRTSPQIQLALFQSDFGDFSSISQFCSDINKFLVNSQTQISEMYFCAGEAKICSFKNADSQSIISNSLINGISPIIILKNLLSNCKDNSNFIFISSLLANVPSPLLATYTSSKSYLSNYILALRRELPNFNFYLFEFGNFSTPFTSKLVGITDFHLRHSDITVADVEDIVKYIFYVITMSKTRFGSLLDPVGTFSWLHYFVRIFLQLLPRSFSSYFIHKVLDRYNFNQ